MNKFMDLEEAKQLGFTKIFNELKRLYLLHQGWLFYFYHKYINKIIDVGSFARRWEYPWAIMNSQIRNGLKVLDAGCGGSPLLAYLYRRGCTCYGVDNIFLQDINPVCSYSKKMRLVRRLSKIYPFYFLINHWANTGLPQKRGALGYNIKYIKGDLIKLPFEDNAFDRIFCISVIEHLSEAQMLESAPEFQRVLKPGGLLILTIDYWGTGMLWRDFISASGLSLFGESDFTVSPEGTYPYNSLGLVLKKDG